MDVWIDRIADIGLNAMGYLVAGGLGMLLHSVLRDQCRKPAPVSEAPTEAVTHSSDQLTPDLNQDIEFVDLRRRSDDEPGESGTVRGLTAPGFTARRDRREIIRIAREMLRAGTADDMIKRTLPISESELTLLQNGNIE